MMLFRFLVSQMIFSKQETSLLTLDTMSLHTCTKLARRTLPSKRLPMFHQTLTSTLRSGRAARIQTF